MRQSLLVVSFLFLSALAAPGLRAADAKKKAAAKPAAETKKEAEAKPAAETKKTGAKSAADLEREKAMQSPYANDMQKTADALKMVDASAYPKEAKEGFELLKKYSSTKKGCAACHGVERPLNSQFVEVDGKTPDERAKNLAALKTSEPDLFKDKAVWQVEDGIWQRYVKRMMAKPGCDIKGPEGKKIWQFLSHDSRARKLGANKEKWAEHRRKLLSEFKEKHPERYKELYGAQEAKP